jgi:hypothetical protein
MKKSSDAENFMFAAFPGGIEAQEKLGQIELENKQQIPREMLCGIEKKDLEELGFILSADFDDELFYDAKFPEGWKTEPTDHSMWSHIVDNKGKKRFAIFYKAAFYDRKAHIAKVESDKEAQ